MRFFSFLFQLRNNRKRIEFAGVKILVWKFMSGGDDCGSEAGTLPVPELLTVNPNEVSLQLQRNSVIALFLDPSIKVNDSLCHN